MSYYENANLDTNAKISKNTVNSGVLVTRIADGSPAEEAGMAEEDIILEINNQETIEIEDLFIEVQKGKINDLVRILGYEMAGSSSLK